MKLHIRILKRIKNILLTFYEILFARKVFYWFNNFLFEISLRGKGINGSYDCKVNGEEKLIRGICDIHKEKLMVFDIGANVGDYSSLVYQYNPNATIFAFEPHPSNYKVLVNNISDNAKTFNVGLGSETARLVLYDYENNDGSPRASIYKEVIEHLYSEKSIGHEIEIIKLDDVIINENIHTIDLLKIDTEGNELEILKGATIALNSNKIKIIQFEFNYPNIMSHSFLYDYYKLLPDYVFYRILRDGLLKINYDAMNEIFLYQNIVAINKSYINNYKNLL